MRCSTSSTAFSRIAIPARFRSSSRSRRTTAPSRRSLAKYRLREGEQAHRFLSSLVFGDFPRLEGLETLAAAAKSLPAILENISQTPDPPLSLRNFVRIVKATGAVKSTLELLGGGGDLLRLLLDTASLSTRLSEIIANRIELLDLLVEGAPPEEPPRRTGRGGRPETPRTSRVVSRAGTKRRSSSSTARTRSRRKDRRSWDRSSRAPPNARSRPSSTGRPRG